MINPMDLSGKTILVTGASSGIGCETCQCLSQLGARVILVSRNLERLNHVVSNLEGSGHIVEPFDLNLLDETPNWLQDLAKKHGLLDGLVHSAGLNMIQPIRLWRAVDADKIMNINVCACMSLAKGFRQKLVHALGASLVFLSSAAGITGQAGLTVYSASKAAVVGITRCLALELVRDGIRVNCVAPGIVESEMVENSFYKALTDEQLANLANKHPLGFGKPRDVANTIAFLLADCSSWINGTTVVIDGGYTI